MILRPRRSILFVAVTGEEEGLLGSDFFAHYPTIAKGNLIADINIDGAALLWPMEDVVARGTEHSTLAAAVREAAARMNIDVSPDPHPESVLFIRSDQYSFVRQGVPSLSLSSGYKSSDPDIKPEEIRKALLANRYHKPQDDMNQAFDFESGARFATYAFLLGHIVAQKTEKPAWNPRDFFGEKYPRTKN
jgi:Zn-dependent M28 family amino/carboxypeptidase